MTNNDLGIQIRWNTLILNRHNLKTEEAELLLKHFTFTSSDLLVFCSNTDIWSELATKMSPEEVSLLRTISTDPRKAHVTIDGMTELNIPPFGTIKNPNPKWVKFTINENRVFVKYDYNE